jgi:hypothetical protein
LRRREGDPGEDRPRETQEPGSGERAGLKCFLEEGAMRVRSSRRELSQPSLNVN